MHFYQEIVQAARVIQVGPVGIVQHANVHLVIILDWLDGEMLHNVIVGVVFVAGAIRNLQTNAIIFVLDGLILIRPELQEGLKDYRISKNTLKVVCKFTTSSITESKTTVWTLWSMTICQKSLMLLESGCWVTIKSLNLLNPNNQEAFM